MRSGVLFSFAVLAVALTACGSDDSPPAGVTGGSDLTLPNACTLVNDSKVTDLFGASVEGTRVSESFGPAALDRCDWGRKDETTLAKTALKLSISSAAAYSGESGLIPSEPYAIGDEGRIQMQNRAVKLIWRSGAYSASLSFAIIGPFSGDFEALRAKTLDIAAAVDSSL